MLTCSEPEVDYSPFDYSLSSHVCEIVLDKVDQVFHDLAKLESGAGLQLSSLLSRFK